VCEDTRGGGNLLLLCACINSVCVEVNGPYGFPSAFSQCFLHDEGFIAGKLWQQFQTERKDKKHVELVLGMLAVF